MKACLVVLGLITQMLVMSSNAAQIEVGPMVRSISVNGSAEVRATPDRATVRMGVQAEAKTAAEAQEQVNKTLNGVLERLEKLEIRRRDIQTSTVHLYPVYASEEQLRRPGGEREVTGFRAEHTLQVRLADLGKVSEVLDAAVQAGANRIDGVSFELENDLEPRLRALEMALKDGRNKARVMAEEMGLRILRVHQVSEGGGGMIPLESRAMLFDRAQGGFAIQPGQITVTSSVSITFELAADPGR